MLNEQKINQTNLVTAAFTPMHPDGSLNLDKIPTLVDLWTQEGMTGLFVCGGAGEGAALTIAERKATAEAYVRAAAGHIPVIVHVGHNSLQEARALAEHASAIGADAIAAMAPTYPLPDSLETLIHCLQTITAGAPDLPLIYYHFPQRTGLTLDVPTFLQHCAQQLPTLIGVKFTDARVFDLQASLEVEQGRYKLFFGWDEMLFSGLAAGAHGGIGSTYNFAAPLYRRILSAFTAGDFTAAQGEQHRAVQMIRAILPHGGLSAQKAIMALIGYDCGPTRLPNAPLSANAVNHLHNELKAIGFFEWARNGASPN